MGADLPWLHHDRAQTPAPAGGGQQREAAAEQAEDDAAPRAWTNPGGDCQNPNPILRGWLQYFRLAEAKGVFEELDGWMRRKLRCVLWRQWKRSRTRRKRLMQRGLDPERAWRSAYNDGGPWWNAGASHMNDAYRAVFFVQLGLPPLIGLHRHLNRA